MIYLCFVIPLATVIFMSWKFPRQTTLWERSLIFAVPAIGIVVAKFASVATQTADTEYWNSHIVQATYYEAWSTWDEETCTREVCTGTGEDEVCHTETYDCSECDRYSEYWEAVDNIGVTYRVSQAFFEHLCELWNTRIFVDMGRSINRHFTCGRDGDAYVTTYDGVFEHTIPVVNRHGYENRVQCSKSVFNFDDIDSATIADHGLFRYPNYEVMGMFNYNPLLGSDDLEASLRLRWHNAHLGASKQVHMMVCVFQDRPYETGVLQEEYWKRGNKNEFILCLGAEGRKIKWTKVISWTDVEDLKIKVERKSKNYGTLDSLTSMVDMMADHVREQYVRKQFADFNYLMVEPTMTAVTITFLVTILVTVGVCLFAVFNGMDCE